MGKSIDLNCDLGEWRTPDGVALDEAIMPYISSCNIACGGHIGDEESIRKTIKLALKYNVAIGAHPAYPDKENFGRVVMDIKPKALTKSLESQIVAFKMLVEDLGGELHHIKPHGALYNYAAINEETAEIIVSVIKSIDPNTLVYLPGNSISAKVAKKSGLKVVDEVFADRVYENDLSLRSRKLKGALLQKESEVIAQLRSLVLNESVVTYQGVLKLISAQTVCLHSDTPGAIKMAKTIHEFLTKHGVEITTV